MCVCLGKFCLTLKVDLSHRITKRRKGYPFPVKTGVDETSYFYFFTLFFYLVERLLFLTVLLRYSKRFVFSAAGECISIILTCLVLSRFKRR